MPVLLYRSCILISFLTIASCTDDRSDASPPASILDSLTVNLNPSFECLDEGEPITINVTAVRKDNLQPAAGVNIQIEAIVYWWLSCSQAGLHDWFVKKTGFATTAGNGTCQIVINAGTSDFPSAHTQHVDVLRVTN